MSGSSVFALVSSTPSKVTWLGFSESTFSVHTILPLVPSITRIRPNVGSQSVAYLQEKGGAVSRRHFQTEGNLSGWRWVL